MMGSKDALSVVKGNLLDRVILQNSPSRTKNRCFLSNPVKVYSYHQKAWGSVKSKACGDWPSWFTSR